MSTVSSNKLKTKDIITVVLLALINVVIFFSSSVLYATPITIILMPVFFALLEGIVYFIIGTKVKKPGAILIYSIVRAIMGGYLPYIILFILSGAIAELLLWKMGYGNAKALTISYVINQVLAAFGNTIIPYASQPRLWQIRWSPMAVRTPFLPHPRCCSPGCLWRWWPV